MVKRNIKIERTSAGKNITIEDETPAPGPSYTRNESDSRYVPKGAFFDPDFQMEYTGIERDSPFFHITKGPGFNGPYLMGRSDDESPNGYVTVDAHKHTHVFGLNDHHPTATATMWEHHQRSTRGPIDHYLGLVAHAAPRQLFSVGRTKDGDPITDAGDHAMYYGPGDVLDFSFPADGRGATAYGNFRVLANAGVSPEAHTFRVAGQWAGFHGAVSPQSPAIANPSTDPESLRITQVAILDVLRNKGLIAR